MRFFSRAIYPQFDEQFRHVEEREALRVRMEGGGGGGGVGIRRLNRD